MEALHVLLVFGFVAYASAAATGVNPTVNATVFDCSAEPNVDYFYADPAGNCDIFYRCLSSNSLAYEYTCSSGQIFYEPNQRCEYPHDVPNSYPCGTGDFTPSGDLPTYDCTGLPDGFYTTEACTNTYYNCDGVVTIATAQNCTEPLVVNTDTNDCDWSYNVAACNAGGTTSTTTVAASTVACPLDCRGESEGYQPDPHSVCSATYYYCDGVSSACYPQTCPAGLIYNDATGNCDWSYSVSGC